MTTPPVPAIDMRVADPDTLVILSSGEAFLLAPSHPKRGADCLIRGASLGGHPVIVTGVASLLGDPCGGGCVISDSFLTHASHLPIEPADLAKALHRGLSCTSDHLTH